MFNNATIDQSFQELRANIDIQNRLLSLNDEKLDEFMMILPDLIYFQEKRRLKQFLQILNFASNARFCLLNIFQQIIIHMKNEITNFFTPLELFVILKNEKLRIFLIESNILSQEDLFDIIASDSSCEKFLNQDYIQFKGMNHDPICEILRKDDVESLKNTSEFPIQKLNGRIQLPSEFESIEFLKTKMNPNDIIYPNPNSKFYSELYLKSNTEEEKPTYLEYAAFFQAYKCVQYLLEETEITKNLNSSMKYAVAGGHYLVVDLFEKKGFTYTEECLYAATIFGHNNLFDYILRKNVPLTINTLKIAILCYNNEIFSYASRKLKNEIKKYDQDESRDGEPLPIYCTMQENIEYLNLLLFISGTSINCRGREGLSCLHYAVLLNSRDIVSLILQNRYCDKNITNNKGETPFFFACKYGRLNVIDIFLKDYQIDKNLPNIKGNTPFLAAVGENQYEMVQLLLKEGKKRNINVSESNKKKENALFLALRKDVKKYMWEMIFLLLNSGVYDQNQLGGAQKNGIIHEAIFYKRYDILQCLIKQKGIDVNMKNQNDESPLQYAIRLNSVEAMRILVNSPNINLKIKDKRGNSGIHLAAQNGSLDVLIFLVTNNIYDPNMKGYLNRTPLHVACLSNHINIISFLCQQEDIDLNPLDIDGYSPFLLVSKEGHPKIVKYFVENSLISVNAQHADGSTALILASQSGSLKTVKCLMSYSNLNLTLSTKNNGWTALHWAFFSKNFEIVYYYINNYFPINVQDNEGYTLLYYASKMEKIEIIQALVANCLIDIYLCDFKNGWSPAHVAVHEGKYNSLRILLESHELNANMKDNNGYTLLHIAVADKNLEMVKFLLQYQCINVVERNNENVICRLHQTPYQMAFALHCKEIGDYLYNYQYKDNEDKQYIRNPFMEMSFDQQKNNVDDISKSFFT